MCSIQCEVLLLKNLEKNTNQVQFPDFIGNREPGRIGYLPKVMD